jgi:type II secretory pathway component PulJ
MLVAMALSSLILLIMYSAHRAITFRIRDFTEVADFYENVNLAIRRIERDITATLYTKDNKKLFFIGENKPDELAQGTINFVTVNRNNFNMVGSVSKELHSCDIKEVGYYLKEDSKFEGLFFLMRRTANQYDDKYDEGGTESLLLKNVVDIKFEFANNNSWEKKWNSTEHKRFPEAVKTTLIVKNFRGVEESFIFLTLLYMHN